MLLADLSLTARRVVGISDGGELRNKKVIWSAVSAFHYCAFCVPLPRVSALIHDTHPSWALIR